MLKEFDELVRQRQELIDWWKQGNLPLQTHDTHHLRMQIPTPTLIEFHNGSSDHYYCPESFRFAMATLAKNWVWMLAEECYHQEIARLEGEINKHRDAVLSLLEAVKPCPSR